MADDGAGRRRGNRRTGSAGVIAEILARIVLPHHAARWIGHQRRHRRIPTVLKNSQLKLYSRILSGDFLHYGYFDDPETEPERLGLHDLQQAQRRFAQEILKLIDRPEEPVLDVGSGMGGFLGLLRSAGFDVTGLTPDITQVEHIRRVYRGVPVLHCRFEDMPADGYAGAFGTVVHAESIQYMKPDRVFPVVSRILAPRGSWIVADYFRTHAEGDRSGWQWEEFRANVDAHGFRVVHLRDITAHVLPTLGFIHLLATRIGLPVFDYSQEKLQAKSPGLHYVLEEMIARYRRSLQRNIAIVDPAEFARHKQYMLVCMRRR